MRRLRVLTVAYALAPVGPDAVGGAEQVASMMDRAVVQAGHESVVVACVGSRVAGRLVATPGCDGTITLAARARIGVAMRDAVQAAAAQVDVVHMHGLDFSDHLPRGGPPVLVTLHLPPAWYPPQALARAGVRYACVSYAQRKACAALNMVEPVLNGVDVEALDGLGVRRGDYAVMLGRICPEKGQREALLAARLADVPLVLAGEVFAYPAHQAYFDDAITPLLDARRRWIGPVGFAQKRRLLSAARCLLVPSSAPETSSLVAMEAAACGTPVVAFRAGALPEIVRDGVTGFLVDDAADMAAAIGRCGGIDARACRQEARARFSHRRMTATYLDLYRRLAA